MRARLNDNDGVDTRFGAVVRTVSLLTAILSVLLFLASPFVAIAGIGMCWETNCNGFRSAAALVLTFSPLLFLMAMAAGFTTFNSQRLSGMMISFMLIVAGLPVLLFVATALGI